MKITKIPPVHPVGIPRDHSKWCGIKDKEIKEPKREVEVCDGDLILYDKYGKLKVYKGEKKHGRY